MLREYPRSRPPLEVYLDGQRLFYRLPVGIFELNLATGEREKRDRLPQQAIAVPPTFNNWTQRDCPAYGEVWDGYRGVEDLLRVLNRRNGS